MASVARSSEPILQESRSIRVESLAWKALAATPASGLSSCAHAKLSLNVDIAQAETLLSETARLGGSGEIAPAK
jgi:hypothetical protein